jgi:hypothetical protein
MPAKYLKLFFVVPRGLAMVVQVLVPLGGEVVDAAE